MAGMIRGFIGVFFILPLFCVVAHGYAKVPYEDPIHGVLESQARNLPNANRMKDHARVDRFFFDWDGDGSRECFVAVAKEGETYLQWFRLNPTACDPISRWFPWNDVPDFKYPVPRAFYWEESIYWLFDSPEERNAIPSCWGMYFDARQVRLVDIEGTVYFVQAHPVGACRELWFYYVSGMRGVREKLGSSDFVDGFCIKLDEKKLAEGSDSPERSFYEELMGDAGDNAGFHVESFALSWGLAQREPSPDWPPPDKKAEAPRVRTLKPDHAQPFWQEFQRQLERFRKSVRNL